MQFIQIVRLMKLIYVILIGCEEKESKWKFIK